MNTIYGFGNALVDVEIKLEEAQLKKVGIEKGSMRHISSQDLNKFLDLYSCLLYTSPSPRDRQKSRMPSSA